MALRELVARQLADALQVPPVAQLQRESRAAPGEAGFGIELGECGIDRRHVAAVAVQEQDLFEPVPRQRTHPVPDRSDKGGRTQRDRSWESEVMLGHADIERRRHQDVRPLLCFMRNDFRAQPVRA
ncbi:hypothetical protein D3C72_1606210 [compost metagenome]